MKMNREQSPHPWVGPKGPIQNDDLLAIPRVFPGVCLLQWTWQGCSGEELEDIGFVFSRGLAGAAVPAVSSIKDHDRCRYRCAVKLSL